ncbi:MAG: MYXO-CTERM sorting domain-containing protein [Byssovorax sp.]
MVRSAALSLAILFGLPGLAFADAGPSPAGTADANGAATAEIAGLEAQLDQDAQRVSTEGCAVACQALGSMRRAADRLCELDRGARCAGARSKVRDAEDRVRASCPECAIPGGTLSPIARGEPAPPPPEPGRAAEEVKTRGGCAGCAITEGDGGAPALALTALGLALALARRRRAPR